MDLVADAATTTGWPLALVIACAALAGRRRESRRRAALNRALHELRRPLQVLALAKSNSAEPRNGDGPGQLDAALAALAELDSQVNGRPFSPVRGPVPVRRLLAEAVERWRSPAALLGRDLELDLPIGEPVLDADRAAVSRALDNLIANSLEHGASRVRIGARIRGRRLRIAITDGATDDTAAGTLAGPLGPRPGGGVDPRRGHGLRVVARIAADHGGRFALLCGDAGSIAVLELPLAAHQELHAG